MKNIEDIKLYSVPLHRLKDKTPIGIGTGCLVDMPDCDYLFTVFHVANAAEGNWGILKEFIVGQGQQYVVVKNFTNQFTINIETHEINDVEFAYKKLPEKFDYFYQNIDYTGMIETSKPIKKIKLQQIKKPNKKNIYGFAGHIQPTNIADKYFETRPVEYENYKYIKTDEWIHIFKPPFNHPGHEFYRGCSGAPIIDEKNNVVSLLVGGNIEKNEIYGVNLIMALTGFNFETGNFKKAMEKV